MRKRATPPAINREDFTERDVEKFWSKVQRGDGCWEWTGTKTAYGYGFPWIGGRFMLAHRASWMFTFGDIENNLWVLHKCDNPPCVNPNHLFLGTAGDNNRDRMKKGRSVRANAKLTPEKVIALRKRYAEIENYSQCAREFGISETNAGLIVKRQRWAGV